jgi:hypothetical protein
VLVVLGSAVLLTALLAGAAYGLLVIEFSRVPKLAVGHLDRAAPGEPTDVLVVLEPPRARRALAPLVTVLRLGASGRVGGLLALPADLYLPVPGAGNEATLAVLLAGGPGALAEALEDDLGVPVDHVLVLREASLPGLVDAVGGLRLRFVAPLRDPVDGLAVTSSGCEAASGTTVVALLASRHAYAFSGGAWSYEGGSAATQALRLDAVLEGLARASDGALHDPLRFVQTAAALAGALELDRGLTLSSLGSLGRGLAAAPGRLGVVGLPTVQTTLPDGVAVRLLGAGATVAIERFLALGLPADAPPASFVPTTSIPAARPSTVSVLVWNGSGVTGIAGSTASALAARGFRVTGASNAPSFSYTTTQVDYGVGDLRAAQLVRSYLLGPVELVADPVLSGTEVRVIIGTSFRGVTRAPSPPSTAPARGMPPPPASPPAPPAPLAGGPLLPVPCAS